MKGMVIKMILADKIINERKKNGWSQEELAERLSVSRQSVSKWESAQSTPDLQKIIQMAELFAVTTDYLLKDDVEPAQPSVMPQEQVSTKPAKQVSMEIASRYLEHKRNNSRTVGIGVILAIISPIVLIFLAGLSDAGTFGITEGLAFAVGISAILIIVAIAVLLFIKSKLPDDLGFIEKEPIETAYGVSGMVREKRKEYESTRNFRTAIGIVLCILCPLPLLVCGATDCPDHILAAMVCVLLAIVSIGAYFFVTTGIIDGSFKALLQEGDYTEKAKENAKKPSPIAAIYWPAVTAGYLLYSFITEDWGRSWIVWPVAGVLFAAVCALVSVISKKK